VVPSLGFCSLFRLPWDAVEVQQQASRHLRAELALEAAERKLFVTILLALVAHVLEVSGIYNPPVFAVTQKKLQSEIAGEP